MPSVPKAAGRDRRASRRAVITAVAAAGLTTACTVAAFLAATWTSAGNPPAARAVTTSSCAPGIAGPFHTSGARVLNSTGQQYVPRGFNITGLAHPLTGQTVAQDEARMNAMASPTWGCANTVRMQVELDEAITAAGHTNPAAMAAIVQEVRHAHKDGLLAVINLQTQQGPDSAQQFMPTRQAEEFWGAMTDEFGRDNSVIFDLFNEPRKVHGWSNWRNGFRRNGIQYYGMQELAQYVRAHGSRNLLWVEGPHMGGSLSHAWAYRLRGVNPLMYSVHRPSGPHTAASWDRSFGYLARRGLAPVLAGEWTDYSRAAASWACWDDAPVTVPRFLNYLRRWQIGLIATQMIPGELIASGNLYDPTQIKPDWRCAPGLDEGAGDLIAHAFAHW